MRSAACVLVFLLASGGYLHAEAPTFAIDNSYERTEQYGAGTDNVTENFDQTYTLGWSETFPEELNADFQFEVTMSDIHNSDGVDTKTITPSLDLGLSQPIWGLSLFASDTIDQTNEFNVDRRDAVEMSADFDFSPNILPTLTATYDLLTDDQPNLEDSVQRRFDLVTDYSFGTSLTLDGSFQVEDFDDRLNDNADTESLQWDVNLSYNRLLTPALKLNVESSWDSDTTDTLNNAGQIISTEESENRDNSIKLTLDAYPRISSDLELSNNREFVEDIDETEFTYNLDTTQQFLGVGDLTETIEISLLRTKSPIPQEDLTDRTLSFDLELAGTPSKWVDYSVGQTFEFTDSQFEDSTLDTDTKSSAFDLSLTVNPFKELTVDTAYNWTVDWEKGSRTSEVKDLKIEFTFEGEVLNIPNLTFNPSYDYSTEDDLEAGETTTSSSLDLEFLYEFTLPPVFTLIVEPVYTIEKDDGQTTAEEVTVEYEAGWALDFSDWSFQLEATGEYVEPIFGGGDVTTSNEMTLTVGTEILGNVRCDLEYTYNEASDTDSEASVELALEWEVYNMGFALTASSDRVFNPEEDETRTYLAEFFMDF